MRHILILTVLTGLALAGQLAGQDSVSALFIQKALDEPAAISLSNITIDDALGAMSNRIGAPFAVDYAAVDKLPYGKLTELASVRFENIAWREALRKLLRPLALRFEVGQDRIYILGSDELLRQPRRLSAVELNALVTLQNTLLIEDEPRILKQLQKRTGVTFGLEVAGKRREKADKDITEDILNDVGQPAATVLDLYVRAIYSGSQKGAWYLRHDPTFPETIDIVIVAAVDLVEMRLDRQIDIQFNQVPVQTVLHELSRQSMVAFRYEPGCLGRLNPDQAENITLVLQQATIRDALEALAANTGLEYALDPHSVYIRAGEALKAEPAGGNRVQRITSHNPLKVILLSNLPGSNIETMLFVREEQLKEAGLLEAFEKSNALRVNELIEYLRAVDEGRIQLAPGSQQP